MANGQVYTGTLADFSPDPRNANKGTERGAYQLEESLRRLGAGRSIVVSADGVILAGNKTAEQAGSIGLERTVVVETDGTQVVVVKRTDLQSGDPRARELAVADNRVGEVSLAWDAAELAALAADEIPVGLYFRQDELDALMMNAAEASGKAVDLDGDAGDGSSSEVRTCHCPKCGFEFEMPHE